MQALLLKFYVLNPLNLNRHYVPSFILTETRARGPKVCASGRGKTLPLITPATVLLSKLCIQVQRRIHIIKSEVAQSRPTLSDPMDCSLPGSSVHGIFQAIVLEWIAISFSRGSSQRRDRTRVSCIAGTLFTI